MKRRNAIIFGPMGAGKGTVAGILINNGYTKCSLGKKIHAEAALHGSESREEMQEYGQAMRRIFGENVWNDYLYQYIKTMYPFVLESGHIVIDDGRQLNEFNYWKEKGFLTVGVTAKEHLRALRLEERDGRPTPPERFKHETEVQALECFEKCDYKIFNDYDFATLRKSVGGIFE